jgi:serine/threonine protein kinase
MNTARAWPKACATTWAWISEDNTEEMIMANTDIYVPWDGWKVVNKIGHGTYGVVYEIERTLFSLTEKAAMKVIRIPRDENDLEMLYLSSGYDEGMIEKSLEDELRRVESEYALMSEMRGVSIIVSCDDFFSFNCQKNNDHCLDIDDEKPRMNDKNAAKIMHKISGCKTVSEFQALAVKVRDEMLRKIREAGISMKQTSRITGISYGVIRKATASVGSRSGPVIA